MKHNLNIPSIYSRIGESFGVPKLTWLVCMLALVLGCGTQVQATDFSVGANSSTVRTLSNSKTSVTSALSGGSAAISSGGGHTLIVSATDGTLWAWGRNDKGQLGDGTTINRNAPVQIGSATNWVAVAAGYNFSLAINRNGELYAWGCNSSSQLGDGSAADNPVPQLVGKTTDSTQFSDWRIDSNEMTPEEHLEREQD